MKKLPIYLSLLFVLTCAKDSTDENSSVYVSPPSNTTNTTPPTSVSQYTITVSAEEGGSVSTAGGTYDDGTSITVTATPSEGYGFIGWSGLNSSNSTITITLTENTTIEALFDNLPDLSITNTDSKIFTKGIGDTLSIEFSHPGGYKSISLSADHGNITIESQPNEGDNDGVIIFNYIPNNIINDSLIEIYNKWTIKEKYTTYLGYDKIDYLIEFNSGLEYDSNITIKTQPDSKYYDYSKPSIDLYNKNLRMDTGAIRYLNQKDNYFLCDLPVPTPNLNQFGLRQDVGGGMPLDLDGDGYEDFLMHPQYNDSDNWDTFTTIPTSFEMYMYRDGGFVYEDLIVSNYPDFKMYLCNKILPGDFDNDGDVDMFLSGTGPDVAPLIGEQSYILENNYSTDGTFFAHPVGPSDGYLHHSATGDLDNDGDLDIMIPRNRNNFLINNGGFNFTAKDGINVVRESDLENINNSNYNYYSDGIGFGNISPSTNYLAISDLNNDTYDDIVVANVEIVIYIENFLNNSSYYSPLGNLIGSPFILWGTSQGEYSVDNMTVLPIVEKFMSPQGVVTYDYDNDGDKDILITRIGLSEIDINNGDDFENRYEYLVQTNRGWGYYLQLLRNDGEEGFTEVSNIIDDYYEIVYQANADGCADTAKRARPIFSDVDEDGFVDLVHTFPLGGYYFRWEWNGSRFVLIESPL
jgi:hypothetical protein